MQKQPLFVTPVPIELAWNEPEENLWRIEEAVREGLASRPELPPESRLFLFPELTLTGFVTKDPSAYEPGHPHIEHLRAIARAAKTGIAAGYPAPNPEDPGRPFNVLALYGPDGELAGEYRKMHLFTWGNSPESQGYTAGRSGRTFVYRGWKVGMAICFDIRFPRLFHSYAREGAELILVSSCWIGGPHKTYQYKTINSAHAILSQAYVAAVNRAGKDPFFEYDGSAYVFSPFGENVFEAAPAEIDAKQLEKARKLVVRPSDLQDYPIEPV